MRANIRTMAYDCCKVSVTFPSLLDDNRSKWRIRNLHGKHHWQSIAMLVFNTLIDVRPEHDGWCRMICGRRRSKRTGTASETLWFGVSSTRQKHVLPGSGRKKSCRNVVTQENRKRLTPGTCPLVIQSYFFMGSNATWVDLRWEWKLTSCHLIRLFQLFLRTLSSFQFAGSICSYFAHSLA